MNLGRLLFPAIRWDAATGFAHARGLLDDALDIGVGGFILFGGNAEAVRDLTRELQARSAHPLLIAADLERGAGQQFTGATPLPPLAAIGALADLEVTRRAGELTAREARALGVNWIYAPVADVDLELRNPIVGTRSFGSDPDTVARHVAAWIRGCHEGGALACAKHFPGHGRTTADSHAELPRVDASASELDADLAPFRAAIDARVDSMMTAHVAYPALDESGAPATLSHDILTRLGREKLGFDGLFVTDALNMAGVLEGARDESAAAVRAIAAGCDALLHPEDIIGVLRAIERAIGAQIPADRVQEALRRIDAAATRVREVPAAAEYGCTGDLAWATQIAIESVRVVRGAPHLPTGSLQVFTVDDDVGGPFPPPARNRFVEALRDAGIDARETDEPDAAEPLVIAVYSDIRAWKGRPGLSSRAVDVVSRIITTDAVVMLFGHPRLAADLPGDHVAAAWGGEWLMQDAAARWLVQRAGSRTLIERN